jgi:hypothetical protein
MLKISTNLNLLCLQHIKNDHGLFALGLCSFMREKEALKRYILNIIKCFLEVITNTNSIISEKFNYKVISTN